MAGVAGGRRPSDDSQQPLPTPCCYLPLGLRVLSALTPRQALEGRSGVSALPGLQYGECRRRITDVKEASAAGGNMLAVASAGMEVVTQFIVASTEPCGRAEALEAAHTSDSTFDAAMILLRSVLPEAAGAVLHIAAQRRVDRPRVGR